MAKKDAKRDVTVPMWIDDIKSFSDFKMTRLSYFAAEADEPMDDWGLILGDTDIPVIIYGLTVAICHPDSTGRHFNSVDDLENLFDSIEDRSALSIETPDLWLPNILFNSKRPPQRGDVFRVKQKLFTAALRFRTNRTSEGEFMDECKKTRQKPSFNPKETKVFADWSTMQINVAQNLYKEAKDPGQYMKY